MANPRTKTTLCFRDGYTKLHVLADAHSTLCGLRPHVDGLCERGTSFHATMPLDQDTNPAHLCPACKRRLSRIDGPVRPHRRHGQEAHL